MKKWHLANIIFFQLYCIIYYLRWVYIFPQTDLTFLKGGQIQPSVNVEHTSSEAGKIPEAQLTAQNCQNLCILFKSFYMCIQA